MDTDMDFLFILEKSKIKNQKSKIGNIYLAAFRVVFQLLYLSKYYQF